MSTQQMTLPARYYTDPGIFSREMETFFRGMWVCAGREEQVENPGDYFLSEVAGESIIATRDSGGGLRAFYNVCRHRGTRMCREHNGKFAARIQCPYHGWTYGLDGRLLGAPHMDEATFQREHYPLHAVHAELGEEAYSSIFRAPQRHSWNSSRTFRRNSRHGRCRNSASANGTITR